MIEIKYDEPHKFMKAAQMALKENFCIERKDNPYQLRFGFVVNRDGSDYHSIWHTHSIGLLYRKAGRNQARKFIKILDGLKEYEDKRQYLRLKEKCELEAGSGNLYANS